MRESEKASERQREREKEQGLNLLVQIVLVNYDPKHLVRVIKRRTK